MGVRVHETGHDDPAAGIDHFRAARDDQAAGAAGVGDAPALDQDGAAPHDAEFPQFRADPRARWTAQRQQLAAIDDGDRHDDCMGSLRPWRSAAAMAVSYPASAWRATPSPGSFVSTRLSRRDASGVPSATLTCPAWIE